MVALGEKCINPEGDMKWIHLIKNTNVIIKVELSQHITNIIHPLWTINAVKNFLVIYPVVVVEIF